MRMELYKVTITRPNRVVSGHLVAPGEQRASEIVLDREIALNQETEGFSLERVDETLPDTQIKGLDALLEYAPAGFASYCEPIGWLAHVVPVQQLRFFRIEEMKGNDHFVIGPTGDLAAAIYCDCAPIEEGEHRMFRIHDGFEGLTNEGRRNLPALLDAGPIGMVDWDDKHGWSPKQM